MTNDKLFDILKQAILMEKRGHSFYSTVAGQTKDPEIKRIFQTMADEETTHVKILSEQFIHLKNVHSFENLELPDIPDMLSGMILSGEVKKNISSAGYEAAAISAAIDMEKRAIEVYGNQAGQTTDPAEKKLFNWLSDWEKGHLKILSDLDNELKEKIWFDNQFWPF
ncbi:MAG: ferritin family protein [bacterium]